MLSWCQKVGAVFFFLVSHTSVKEPSYHLHRPFLKKVCTILFPTTGFLKGVDLLKACVRAPAVSQRSVRHACAHGHFVVNAFIRFLYDHQVLALDDVMQNVGIPQIVSLQKKKTGDHQRKFFSSVGCVHMVLSSHVIRDLVKQGLNHATATSLVRALAKAGMNWRMQMRPGMVLSVLFKQRTSTGAFQNLLFAQLQSKDMQRRVYYYKPIGASSAKFYNDQGMTCNTREGFGFPIRKARLSSQFGVRYHPVHHSYKMHKGIDLAAPEGTPVYAAAGGIVEKIGWKGGYGKYVRIRHMNGYRTAYCHLKGYRCGLKVGQYVSKSQIIGYVGSTGCATGAHLHFEVLAGNQPVNPLKKVLQNEYLNTKQKSQFQSYTRMLWRLYRKLLKQTSCTKSHCS